MTTLDTFYPPSVKSVDRTKMRLRKERKAAGLTQAQLSKMARVPQGSISRLERGDILSPTLETLDRLARVLQRCGRRVDVFQLQPKRQPALIKGLHVLPKHRRSA